MKITSTILNQYAACHRTSTLDLSYSSGGISRCSSLSLFDGGRKWRADKDPQRAGCSEHSPLMPLLNPRLHLPPNLGTSALITNGRRNIQKPLVLFLIAQQRSQRFSLPSRAWKGAGRCSSSASSGSSPSARRAWSGSGTRPGRSGSCKVSGPSPSQSKPVFIKVDKEDDMVWVWPRSRWFVCDTPINKWARGFLL